MTNATKPRVTKPRSERAVCITCGARLSSYNPGPHCYTHTLDLPWKGPGLRPR